MTTTLTPQLSFRPGPLVLFGLLATLLVAVEHAVVGRADFGQHPALPIAVFCDLLLVLPAMFYLCIVRQYQLPLSTLAAVVGGGLALSHWLLPAESLSVMAWASRLGAALEMLTFAYAVVRVRRIRQGYQAARQQSADFIDNLHMAGQPVLGRLTGGLVTELVLFRYALLGPWAPAEVRPGELTFSTYRQSGLLALLAAAGLMGLVEVAAVHLFVGHWYPRGAWLLTLPSLYGLLLLLAHAHAVRLRPVTLSSQTIVVRAGLSWRIAIGQTQLVALEQITQAPQPAFDCLNAAQHLFTTPNLLLTLAEAQTAHGPYGLRRSVRQLAIYVDDPTAFCQALSGK